MLKEVSAQAMPLVCHQAGDGDSIFRLLCWATVPARTVTFADVAESTGLVAARRLRLARLLGFPGVVGQPDGSAVLTWAVDAPQLLT